MKEECPECKKNGAKMFKETCTDTLTDIVLIRQLVDVVVFCWMFAKSCVSSQVHC